MKYPIILILALICFILFEACMKHDFAKLIQKRQLKDMNYYSFNLQGNGPLKDSLLNFLFNTYKAKNSHGTLQFKGMKLDDQSIFIFLNGGDENIDTLIILNTNDTIINNQGFRWNSNQINSGSVLRYKFIYMGVEYPDSIYIPRSSNFYNENITSIQRSIGNTLHWTIDTSTKNNKGILLELAYWGGIELLRDSTQIDTFIERKYVVEDNGSFELSSSILNPFPNCNSFVVNVIRGNYKGTYVGPYVIPIFYYEELGSNYQLTD